ncbi:hypothetical protein GY45DRAFT_262741 [Cubamyces sp. BRFM 1775]|nr:hypothetical protein GY45DRAFT_262741 [Cubamyces sp. BRFM 1775]
MSIVMHSIEYHHEAAGNHSFDYHPPPPSHPPHHLLLPYRFTWHWRRYQQTNAQAIRLPIVCLRTPSVLTRANCCFIGGSEHMPEVTGYSVFVVFHRLSGLGVLVIHWLSFLPLNLVEVGRLWSCLARSIDALIIARSSVTIRMPHTYTLYRLAQESNATHNWRLGPF